MIIDSHCHLDYPILFNNLDDVIKRAEMLGELLKTKGNSIAISGTHGKTTTTSMLGTMLDEVGLKPTIVVGGIVQGIKSNSLLGDGDIIIVEADEYDKTLLSLNPSMSIVTNIDHEHIDSYPSLDSLKETFIKFINSMKSKSDYNFNDFGILYRTNSQSRVIEDGLRRRGIPYIIIGGIKFYDRKEVKDILAYLRIIVNSMDTISLERILNFPPRGIGQTTLKKLIT